MKSHLPIIVLMAFLLWYCAKEDDVELEPGFIDGKIVYSDGDIYTKDLNWTI